MAAAAAPDLAMKSRREVFIGHTFQQYADDSRPERQCKARIFASPQAPVRVGLSSPKSASSPRTSTYRMSLAAFIKSTPLFGHKKVKVAFGLGGSNDRIRAALP